MGAKVAIIVLNWNGWRDTLECLESLRQIDYGNSNVILVDNASDDESLARIDAYCTNERNFRSYSTQDIIRDRLTTIVHYVQSGTETGDSCGRQGARAPANHTFTLITNDQNYGFCEGNNIAVAYALDTKSPDYVLLLNNDTVVERHFLNELVNAAEQDDQIGLLQPKILHHGRSTIDNTGVMCDFFASPQRRGSYEKDEGLYDDHRKDGFFFASGACVLIRKSLLLAFSGECFDPYLFAYAEDMDLSWKARLVGFSIVYCPESVCYHKVSSTFGKRNPSTTYLHWRNRLRVMVKNYALLTLVFVLPLTISLQLSMSLISFIINFDLNYIINLFKALFWNVVNLRSALIMRTSIQSKRKLCDKAIMNSMVPYSLEARSVLKRLWKTRYSG